MVVYIRFLKPPSIHPSRKANHVTLRAVLTITTDLGDAFYDHPLALSISICQLEFHSPVRSLRNTSLQWHPGARAVPLIWDFKPPSNTWDLLPLSLYVSSTAGRTTVPGSPHLNAIPEVVTACSDSFTLVEGSVAARSVLRRFRLGPEARELWIWEETGESIARHVW